MQQLSLRGFDKELERQIRLLARRERISLNRAALTLLRRGAGVMDAPDAAGTVGPALDSFVGRWSARDGRRLLDSIAACGAVDRELWR
jgi:hypothetical protein